MGVSPRILLLSPILLIRISQSVELRFPKDGLKTKWVKVVLRKVETLPGGVPASLTPDFIGQMPQTIWAAAGEYETIINVSMNSYI